LREQKKAFSERDLPSFVHSQATKHNFAWQFE